MAQKGFTIIELIISIFILTIAIVGIYNAFSVVTILTSDSVDRLTASYLAQEGMEIVRNIREINWLNMDVGNPTNASWLDGLSLYGANNNFDCNTQGCEVDYTTTGSSSNLVLRQVGDYLNIDTNGFYGYGAGTPTKFKRKIIITPIQDVDYSPSNPPPYLYHIIKVTTQVSWDEKATITNPSGFSASSCVEGGNCIVAKETLYDWYNHPGSDKDILTFNYGFAGETDDIKPGVITVHIPAQAGITALTATFTTTKNAPVTINGVNQISGTTTNSFTAPLTSYVYTVTAADGTTQAYTVSVNMP